MTNPEPLPPSHRPFGTEEPNPAVPCPFCAQPFPTASLLQAHLELDHGQKRKKVKAVKMKTEDGYRPRNYNPAKGFLTAAVVGVVAAVAIATAVFTLAARAGLFDR